MYISIVEELKNRIQTVLKQGFQLDMSQQELLINKIDSELKGDYALVCFPLSKSLKLKPEEVAQSIGRLLLHQPNPVVKEYEVVKGFLNIVLTEAYWINILNQDRVLSLAACVTKKGRVVVEYSSPNANKPLHLGHLRNNFIGVSLCNILMAVGYDVVKTCVVNDRGIHICKSMAAWILYGNQATPQTSHIKGDLFVGNYYVLFNQQYLKEVATLQQTGKTKQEAEAAAPIMEKARQLLLLWEQGDPETIELWKRMNSWVYSGFEETYRSIGTQFDAIYYESNTYLLGKKIIEEGLKKNVLFEKKDGSVWIDLTQDGLDEKLLLRADGTSVYITQDLGLAQLKFEDYQAEKSIYVVGNEQDYHFEVLKKIFYRLGLPFAQSILHLSYGMVELPEGKMKSREGTVIDADDIINDMKSIAAANTRQLGKVEHFSQEDLAVHNSILGMGALKFFLLKINPQKKIVFNPQESIDFKGFTAAFIQYVFARIQSILSKSNQSNAPYVLSNPMLPLEKKMIACINAYPAIVIEAAEKLDPSIVAHYLYQICQLFNTFYSQLSITKAENEDKRVLRLKIINHLALIIQSGMRLLSIEVPKQM